MTIVTLEDLRSRWEAGEVLQVFESRDNTTVTVMLKHENIYYILRYFTMAGKWFVSYDGQGTLIEALTILNHNKELL